ncbi:hypothetical protein GJAV_G00143040 [Gymnothorax javanicus]|nr:hypothetical protein GJAV_G00143040 [Gymnothorax javanicus]
MLSSGHWAQEIQLTVWKSQLRHFPRQLGRQEKQGGDTTVAHQGGQTNRRTTVACWVKSFYAAPECVTLEKIAPWDLAFRDFAVFTSARAGICHVRRPAPELRDIVRVALSSKVETGQRTKVEEDDDSNSESKRTDRLLCLDGGGIRGLVLIQMLMALEQEAGRPVKKLFDWISGTSTGGILALGILHDMSLKDLQSLYFSMKDEVFTESLHNDSSQLEKLLKEKFGEDTKMTKFKHPRVIVMGVLADRRPEELHLFRNYDDPPALTRDSPYASTDSFHPVPSPHEQHVWEASRATSAAPKYFLPMRSFLDGGLLANNPTLDSMVEIHRYNKALIDQGKESEVQRLGVVVSLGTGKPPQVKSSPVVFDPSLWHPLRTKKEIEELIFTLVDCCTVTDCCAVDRARTWCEQTNTSYYRLTPQLNEEVKLNETDSKVLMNMMWETKKYLSEKENKKGIQALAKKLVQD